jgi:predicted RNase H-related nuclease YkuK (DUF458 family)
MERKFQSLTNGQYIDLIPYLKMKLAEADNIKMYVGTDSQNIGRNTIYATVIVLHYGNSGGHVVYSKMKVPRINDKFTKLWNEVQDSVELAQYLEANGIEKPAYIDLDFNPDPRYQSNTVLRAALGYVESLGYSPRCKPDAVSASYIADKICK